MTGHAVAPTIRGIGVDLERIARFKFALREAGEPFTARVYTASERRLISGDVALFALVFTAKEASAKALGMGLGDDEIDCQDVEVTIDSLSGTTKVTLTARAEAAARRQGVSRVLLASRSIGDHALSVAWAVGGDGDAAGLAVALRQATDRWSFARDSLRGSR